MLVVDAQPRAIAAGQSAQASFRELLHEHDETILRALVELKEMAQALPTASPVRDLLERQARQLGNVAGVFEAERYRAIALVERRQV